MQSKATRIEDYLCELGPKEAEVMRSLDKLVRERLPAAVGVMKYGMPTYEYKARVLSINAQKQHFSVYADPAILEPYRAELKQLSVGKGCIRFKSQETAPTAILRKILADYAR